MAAETAGAKGGKSGGVAGIAIVGVGDFGQFVDEGLLLRAGLRAEERVEGEHLVLLVGHIEHI